MIGHGNRRIAQTETCVHAIAGCTAVRHEFFLSSSTWAKTCAGKGRSTVEMTAEAKSWMTAQGPVWWPHTTLPEQMTQHLQEELQPIRVHPTTASLLTIPAILQARLRELHAQDKQSLVEDLLRQLQATIAEGCYSRWQKRETELHKYAKEHNMDIWPKGRRFILHAINDLNASPEEDDGTNSRGLSGRARRQPQNSWATKTRRVTAGNTNRDNRRADVSGGGGGGGGSGGGNANNNHGKRPSNRSQDIRLMFKRARIRHESEETGIT